MDIQGLYAAVSVSDLEKSENFFTRLLGREPDDRPMEDLIQWRGFGTAGIQLFFNADLAGKGRMTIVTPDMEATSTILAKEGVDLGRVSEGLFGRIATISDPDGNLIVIAEPPRGFAGD